MKVTECTITEVIGLPESGVRYATRKYNSCGVQARYTEGGGNAGMKVGVLFFGVLKDLVGRSTETLDLPEGARVREVLSYYAGQAPRFEAMLPSLAISVNQEYSESDRTLRAGDEVGLFRR